MNRIRYMGNKHALAQDVVRLVEGEARSVPLLDLFCGLCSVGTAIAPSGRPVWGNDVQAYAALAARCYLSEVEEPLAPDQLATALMPFVGRNKRALECRFGDDLALERAVLKSGDLARYRKAQSAWRHAGNSADLEAEARQLARRRESPNRLFVLNFAWSYFGLEQAAVIDSVRSAIDTAANIGRISLGQARWALFGLLEAASVCASTSGHFAQYLKGTSATGLARLLRQRRRDVWQEFLVSVGRQRPIGPRSWRSQNLVLSQDALQVWGALDEQRCDRVIVYADPPYSKDHYSRYYHVLETLVRYDYPEAIGSGRYRPDRFATEFSYKTRAIDAFATLFDNVAERGWALVLSYPSNGLVCESEVHAALSARFASTHVAVRKPFAHSTLGARHGAARRSADEIMWVAA